MHTAQSPVFLYKMANCWKAECLLQVLDSAALGWVVNVDNCKKRQQSREPRAIYNPLIIFGAILKLCQRSNMSRTVEADLKWIGTNEERLGWLKREVSSLLFHRLTWTWDCQIDFWPLLMHCGIWSAANLICLHYFRLIWSLLLLQLVSPTFPPISAQTQ